MDSMETVCRAIDAFYSGGPDVQPAQQFLQQFQESTESWTICDQIIRLHSNSLACYFASQTLRTKILKKFSQLPPDQYEPLRQSLLQHLDRHGASAHDAQSEATATQLCLAIADLYIQVPTWNNWIFELLNQCQSLEGDRTIMTLTLLQVFPEEVENIRGIGENRRIAIREELAGCEQPMISFMSHVLEKFHSNADVLKRVFKCLESNLQNHQMRTDHFAQSPLISSIFHVIASIDPAIPSCLHETATNCIVAALFRVEEIDLHRRLAEVIHRGVISLVGPFQKAQQLEDFDRLQNIARIFVELVESFYVIIVTEANPDPTAVGSLACFELLLLVAGHHDWALIEMSFNVWYRITEELFKYDDDQYIGRFRPYAEKFIDCLYEHCKMDADDVDDILDESSEFGEFRLKAIEALRDVVFIVNSDKCIQMMHQKLIECCRKPNASWEESESALFVMAAVVQNLLPESDTNMPEVLQLICSLPVQSPPALIATSLNLISDLNDWFEQHSDLLEPVVQWILRFATDTRFACHVAVCFDRITAKCPTKMMSLLPQLMSLIGVLEQTTTNGLKVEEAICSLTRAISTIISKLPAAESKLAMEQLCEPIIRNLIRLQTTDATEATIANNNNNSGGGANKENEGSGKKSHESWASLSTRPMVWIDRAAFVFKDVWTSPSSNRNGPAIHQECPWLPIAQQFIEALLKATRKFEGTPRLIEHSIRSCRLIFRALGPQSISFVEPVVHMMIETYPKHQHSSYLYLASVIVDEYGQLDKMRPGLIQMLDTLARHTFPLLQGDGAINHPDTVDDLFRLAQRFTMRATTVFFTNQVSQLLFLCAVSTLRLDHQEASRSITKFILEVLEQLAMAKKNSYTDEGVTTAQVLVEHQAQNILTNALWMSLFSHSGQIRRDMSDVILQIGKHDPTKFEERLTMAVLSLPNNPIKATEKQLSDFVDNVAKERERHHVFGHTRDLAKLFI
uniref:Importin N-terminal domain-containing protein n=1 Tax=Caenorhabditis tropicalis TaxID=1561998 RepID=A0A1I7T5Y1_9PELO